MTYINYAKIDYVVGIDFGTTFSGISHAFTRDNIQRPRQKGCNDNQMIPTACIYDKKQQKFTQWGQDALDSNTQQDDSMILVEHFGEQIRVILESKTGTSSGGSNDLFYKDAAIYFLRQIIQYTRKEIEGHIIKHPVFLYVLPLRSNWSAVARYEMKHLFTESILDADDYFEIIEQSKAAVLYCQNKNDEPIILAPGESYLVCDLGRDTSNFALFESVTGHHTQTHAIFKAQDNENVESVISFGTSHIDKKMNEYISRKVFKNNANAIVNSCSLIHHLMDFFIHSVKSTFGETEGESMSIPLENDGATIKPSLMAPLTKDGTVTEGKLHISYEEMCTHVFDPVVDRVITSMETLIFEKNIKSAYIITDSGTYYLVSKIEERLEQNNIEKLSNTMDEQYMDGAVFYGLRKVNAARENWN